jgi:hypothetical protein
MISFDLTSFRRKHGRLKMGQMSYYLTAFSFISLHFLMVSSLSMSPAQAQNQKTNLTDSQIFRVPSASIKNSGTNSSANLQTRQLIRKSSRSKSEKVASEFRMSELLKTPRSRYLSPVSGVTVGQNPQAEAKSGSDIFSGTFYLIRGTSPRAEKPEESNARKEALVYYLLLGARFNENWSAGTEITYSQDLNQRSRSAWSDTPLALTYRGLKPAPALGMSAALIGVMPTSNASKNRALQYGLGGGLRFWITPAYMPISEKLSLSLYANLIKGNHSRQFDEPAHPDSPIDYFNSYTSRQTLSLGYKGEIFFASIDFNHRNAITYENKLKEAYLHAETLGVVLDDRFTLALSHEMGGPAHDENGQSNYYFYSNDNSYYSAIVGVSF